jgi:hypothetical protein
MKHGLLQYTTLDPDHMVMKVLLIVLKAMAWTQTFKMSDMR